METDQQNSLEGPAALSCVNILCTCLAAVMTSCFVVFLPVENRIVPIAYLMGNFVALSTDDTVTTSE